jgi:hypothetical protein
MGNWDEFCICCGLGFKTFDDDVESRYDPVYDARSIQTLLNAKLPNTNWLHHVIGINRFEELVPLGNYDDYGSFAFALNHRSTFGTVTNFVNDNYKSEDDYGIVCHVACYAILRRYLHITLSYRVLWPILVDQHDLGNVMRSLNYGAVKNYETQDFDFLKMVKDHNQWMLANPLESARSRRRILKIVRPLTKLVK